MSDEQNRTRIERLVREHYAFVWRSARRIGVPPADVDDLVQEVFLLAVRKIDEIRHERGYLFKTCLYVAGHTRRTASRRREVIDVERVHAAIDDRTPEQDALHAEALAELQSILDQMPEDMRVTFIMHELERFTAVEIAEVTGAPLGTIASRLRRGREFFLSRAGATGEGER